MKKHSALLLLGAGLVFPAQAQSFGDFLKSAVAETAKNVITNSATKALTAAAEQPKAPAAGSDAGAALVATAAPGGAAAAPAAAPSSCGRGKGARFAAAGPKPDAFEPAILWPENTQCPVGSFADYGFEKAKAAKNAFREASKYRCSDCEGGYYFDAWGGRSLIKQGEDYSRAFPKLLLALEPGKSVGWKGTRYQVTITAAGEKPIGEIPCKILHYTLKDGGKTVSEYDGMFCKYLAPYSSEPSWNEVI